MEKLNALLSELKTREDAMSASKIQAIASVANASYLKDYTGEIAQSLIDFITLSHRNHRLGFFYVLDAVLRKEKKNNPSEFTEPIALAVEYRVVELVGLFEAASDKERTQVAKILGKWKEHHIFEDKILERCASALKVEIPEIGARTHNKASRGGGGSGDPIPPYASSQLDPIHSSSSTSISQHDSALPPPLQMTLNDRGPSAAAPPQQPPRPPQLQQQPYRPGFPPSYPPMAPPLISTSTSMQHSHQLPQQQQYTPMQMSQFPSTSQFPPSGLPPRPFYAGGGSGGGGSGGSSSYYPQAPSSTSSQSYQIPRPAPPVQAPRPLDSSSSVYQPPPPAIPPPPPGSSMRNVGNNNNNLLHARPPSQPVPPPPPSGWGSTALLSKPAATASLSSSTIPSSSSAAPAGGWSAFVMQHQQRQTPPASSRPSESDGAGGGEVKRMRGGPDDYSHRE